MNILFNIVAKYSLDIPTKLLDWIPMDNIDWNLSLNPAAIHLLEKNLNKIINRKYLSSNPAAIHILEKNPDKIYWDMLSKNPAAIHLLEKNPYKIYWGMLSLNPAAIHLLEKNLGKINWSCLSLNPVIFEINKIVHRSLLKSFLDNVNK
jgi:hypothetical protein